MELILVRKSRPSATAKVINGIGLSQGSFDDGVVADLERDDDHKREAGGVDGVEEGAHYDRTVCRSAAIISESSPTKMNDGRKMPKRGGERAAEARDLVADEGRGGEKRARSKLAHGDGIDELAVGDPVQTLDEIGAEEREQHVAAAVEH